MRKLNLQVGEKLQEEFSPQRLNLLLVFQVNCPGCFTYALPTFNELYEKYAGELGFLALSTAFEDFELNTSNNTRLLLEKGELVGETKRALTDYSLDPFPLPLSFPMAMDAKMQPEDREGLIENICYLNPNYQVWPQYDKNLMRKRVAEYLDAHKEISLTFTSNQFKGTPTFVFFDQQNYVLSSWFGHVAIKTIEDEIIAAIDKDC